MDGQYTFEELKHAVNRVTLNCSVTHVVDFLSNAHREGHLSNNHYSLLIDDISIVTKEKKHTISDNTANTINPNDLPAELTVLNNRFVLGPIIGKGGMGVVYKARDLRKMEVNDKDDVVAIKILSAELRALPKYLIALQREAKKAQKLAHPNIVTVYDFDRDGDIAYMTMEYLDGVSLSKIIQVRAPLGRKEATRIVRNIARGLAYAHKQKIVHSDLKPGNIFLLKNGSIKILDFGIARALHTNDEKTDKTILSHTQAISAFTPAYASCEITNNAPPTPKDDIYALGCIAHELLTGTHPYERLSADKAKEEKLTLKQNKHLTHHLHRAIAHAVELDKDKRVESVSDFVLELAGQKSKPFLSSRPVKTLSLALAALLISGGIYTTSKIRRQEAITAQQAMIINKFEIENSLKQADDYFKNNEYSIRGKNNALTLYQHILKIDPDNTQAKTGINKIKEKYKQHIDNAIELNKLILAKELIDDLETSFNGHIDLQHLRDRLERSMAINRVNLLFEKARNETTDNYHVRPENVKPNEQNKTASSSNKNNNDKINRGYDKTGEIKLPSKKLTRSQQRLIDLHNNRADTLSNKDHHYGPDNNNAAYHFKRVLSIDPDNEYARNGLKKAWLKLNDNINNKILNNNYSTALDDIEQSKIHFYPFHDAETVISDLLKKRDKHLTDTSRNHDIELRLTQAKIQLKADHWIAPKGNNALETYLEVQKTDPNNEDAKSGLRIVEHKFSSLIKTHIDRKKYSKANKLLKRALGVFPRSRELNNLKQLLPNTNRTTKQESQPLNIPKQITSLSHNARTALERKRYIFPTGRSAYDLYSKIISLDPGNKVGTRGLNEAKLRAYDQIESHIKVKNYLIAHKMISRLLNLGIRDDKRLDSLQSSLLNTDISHTQPNLSQNIPDNYLIYLLRFASQQESKGVIWPPQINNAYSVYKHVNDIEPLNKVARESLSKLFNIKISSIKNLLDSNRLYEAERELLALEKLYGGKKEKEIISMTIRELKTLQNMNFQL